MKDSLINRAKVYAYKAHSTQLDDNGYPFIFHPLQVAMLVQLVAPHDENLIAAAFLHDVIEDCGVTAEELANEFNNADVVSLVLEVTHEGAKKTGYYFPRLVTQRGIMLKFCDRLSNISRMEAWDDERKLHYLKKSKFWKDKE